MNNVILSTFEIHCDIADQSENEKNEKKEEKNTKKNTNLFE